MKFTLSVISNIGSNICITEFDPAHEQHNLNSTFNEKISCQDNDQTTLTFSISKKIPNEKGNLVINPILTYLKFGNQLTLNTEVATYDFIITNITPELKNKNVIYNFTCQDMVSYKWSRIKLGYSYNTMERGGVKTLYTIAAEILNDCELDESWFIKDINSHFYPNKELKTEKITLQVDDSNPYNALVEALNVLNASMLVDYRTHEIRFYQKDKVAFSGYRYRPETNLRALSADYNIDELATILHVSGGTDEAGMNVMLVPPMPTAIKNYLEDPEVNYVLPEGGYSAIPKQKNFKYVMETNNIDPNSTEYQIFKQEKDDVNAFCTIADRVPSLGQFLYNFDFFRQNGTMSEAQYNNIKIILDVNMRDINLRLKPLTITYYDLSWKIQKNLIDVNSKLEQINAIYAAQMNGDNTDNQSELHKLDTEIKTLLGTDFHHNYLRLYNNKIKLTDGKFVPEIQDIVNNITSYIKIRNDAEYYYNKYQDTYKATYGEYFVGVSTDEITENNYDKAQLQADILYYKDRYYMSLQMCGLAIGIEDFIAHKNKRSYPLSYDILDGNVSNVEYAMSYYGIYWEKFVEKIQPNENSSGSVYETMISLEQQIKNLWSNLYAQYSSFIYEAVYENADELNSVSLYNQAISYFENYHHPKSSYSVEIINFEDLEQIGVPNLKVNSRIRVYNEDLNLNEDGELNNISYTENELTITGLDYELRKSAVMSISVESTIQHQNILQKLIKSIR